jgi:DNA-binding NtrC family response regulator
MDQKKCILIVDDEPNVRLMLSTALESVGYQVALAEDGERALAKLESRGSAVDLVLLDLQMPRMDGMALLSRLRASGSIAPVVILTAHGSIPEAVTAMKLGAIDFLTKPIRPEALRRAVAEVIERHAVAPPALRPTEAIRNPTDRSKQLAFELARAKRALIRGQFTEAETVLREILAAEPGSAEAGMLLDRLEQLREQEVQGPYRILRDWFPSGSARRKS